MQYVPGVIIFFRAGAYFQSFTVLIFYSNMNADEYSGPSI